MIMFSFMVSIRALVRATKCLPLSRSKGPSYFFFGFQGTAERLWYNFSMILSFL